MWCSKIFRLFIGITVSKLFSTGPVVVSKKCCEPNGRMDSDNRIWFCNEGNQIRKRVILSDDPKFNISTECEFFNGFIPQEVLASVSKCCPPNSFYNPRSHSCVHMPNKSNFFESFSKIGLPQCLVISDSNYPANFDIRNGSLFAYSEAKSDFCVDENVDGGFSVRVCRDIGVCEKMRCIRKCCPDGQSFVDGSFCRNTFEYGLQFLHHVRDFIGNDSDDFAIIHSYPGPGKVHKVDNPSNFSLDEKGNFYDLANDKIYPPNDQPYCIEHASKNNITYGHKYFGYLVGSGPPLPTKFLSNRAAMILSGIFLVLTMMFYVGTKEIRKVFAKAMVSFCSSLLALYVILVYCTFTRELHYKSNKVACKVIGFLSIYLSLCSFVWLQIISADIFWTFGSTRNFSSNNEKKRKAFRRFIFYSLYGWGLPMIITAVSIFFHYLNVLPAPIEIRMGVTKCAIERSDGNYAEMLFLTFPLTVIQIVNVTLFIKTIKYCLKVKNDIKKMTESALNLKKKKKFFAKRARFQLVVKLSLTMGISYVFEVVSTFIDFKSNTFTSIIEIIWDFINCLQGVFIFLIFVCKKKNIVTCKKSAAVEKIRKISLSSTRTTTVSSVTRKTSQSRIKMTEEEPKQDNP